MPGQRTWGGGSAEPRVKKGKRIPSLCRTTSVLRSPKSDVTSGSIWMRGLHDLFNTRPSSLSQYQVSSCWCSGSCNRAEVKIWVSWSWRRCSTSKLCSATADWSGHVRQMCLWRSFTWRLSGMLHTSGFFSPRSSFTCWQKFWDHPREQANKLNVVPSQHPI